ncbi:MAG TPA: serine/threonine-protein kinase, partial [Kofleriaceae bacterium]
MPDAIDETLRAEASFDPGDGAASGAPVPPAQRYRLGAELGRGGMGRVVEAFDVQLGRTVALKEVLPRGGANVARRFAREVQLTARLEHPSIIPLYDSGTTVDGRPFYVMRRVSGRPLDQLMTEAGNLDARLTLLPSLLAAIDAVAHAHRRGVIHRDLKPANILVGELGETVVIDWGLAKVIGEDDEKPGTVIVASDSLRTQIGSVFGTPGFMAPEQARGEELDPRSDVYALGATLYQLLAGAPPHAGTSASEVIANTGSRAVTPVNVIAPGAPRDLVAIVGKALAFDAAGRYPDAGALGEDVRRFLAGQLVAAHRYTRRQRLSRFARRHRAPLFVAALAAVAVAALAWVGVARIVAERDLANLARADAAHGREAAERARDEAERRADQLVVEQARGLLDRNPTHAAAALKELPETSPRVGDARAVAQAAVVRGAAWSIPIGDALTVIAELSVDAKFLLQVTRDGVVRVWDLDHRRQVIERTYPSGARALWTGKTLLVSHEGQAPELLDPFSATTRPLAIAPIAWATATTAGDRVAYLDDHHGANLLDVATAAVRPLWPGHRVTSLAIAHDGSWIEVADKTTVAVLDPTGRELASHPGDAGQLLGSRFGDAGFLATDRAVICKLQPRPTWTEVSLAAMRPLLPVQAVFRGRELDIYMSGGKVMAWNGERLWERIKLDGLTYSMIEAYDELLVAPGIDGKLHFANDLVVGELHLPQPVANLKVFARPAVPRVVVVGRGAIVGFDLGDAIPQHLRQARHASAIFVDDDTLLLTRSASTEWQWYDVKTQRATPFTYDPAGLPSVMDVDPGDGRVLIHELGNDTVIVLLHKNTAQQRRLVRGRAAWGRLLPHDTVLFGVGDNRLFAITGDAPAPPGTPPLEIAKLDGIAVAAVGLGGTRFAALSSTGEVVRGDLADRSLARARLPAAAHHVVAGDRTGRVVLAADNRL